MSEGYVQAHNQPISSSWTVHAWRTLCTFYLRSWGDYMRFYEIIWDPLGAWGGGWRGAPKVPADNTHASCTSTHMRDPCMHVSPTHSTTLHTSYMHEMQMRLYEILRDSAPVRGGSAVGNRRFGSTNHPRNAPLFFDHLYFPNCISCAFPSSMQYFQKRVLFLTNNV